MRILCTVYDPITGEYRYKRSILFELTGGLIGLTLIAWFMVRELRKRGTGAARGEARQDSSDGSRADGYERQPNRNR